MPLPKIVAAGVSVVVLGAQILISSPFSPERDGWYWPFLAYPMYSASHTRADSIIDSELRVIRCGTAGFSEVLPSDSLGAPPYQLLDLLEVIGRAPESARGRRAEARVARAIDAQFPGRYCAASAWLRVAYVADTVTYVVHAPMRRIAVWALDRAGRK